MTASATGTMTDATRDRIRRVANAWLVAKQELAKEQADDFAWIERVAQRTQDSIPLDELVQQHAQAQQDGENLKKRQEALTSFTEDAPKLILQLSSESPADAEALLLQEVEAREKRADDHDRKESGIRDGTKDLKALITKVKKAASGGASATSS